MGEFMYFHDRCDAGAQLARQLQAFHGDCQALVLALPRGGVPVAFVVAAALDLPLDVMVVRKLGVPGQPEYAMGAVASGARILHQPVIDQLRIPGHAVEQAVIRETLELERREALYRGGRAPLQLEGRHVLLVDDGLATGATMRAAVRVVKQQHPAQLVVAVPVAAPDTRDALASEVDQLICLHAPLRFQSVSQWYRDFPQTTDAEVLELLHTAAQRRTGEAETGTARQPSPEAQIATQFLR